MKQVLIAVVLAGFTAMLLPGSSAEAGSRKHRSKSNNQQLSVHPKSNYYRSGGAQVRGYRKRVGGYSYSFSDTINTYGDSRTRFGSTNSYRDPMLGRQTTSGPFDHGFFFESGVAPRGGNSPYLN